MERIISDVLALTRTDVDDLETRPVSLAETAEAAWQNVDTRSAPLSVSVTGEVEANRSVLTQMFENLYRNAVEHAGPDVAVTVGTGLGLTIVGRIACAHDWPVAATESTAGGARFDITLPTDSTREPATP